MGKEVEFNPLMNQQWRIVQIPRRPDDFVLGVGTRLGNWEKWEVRIREAREWCGSEMIHGRWSFDYNRFLFKGKKDALIFKLTWGGA